MAITSWRVAGLNYIQYSNICAQILRLALKPDLRADAIKRQESIVKVVQWVNGSPIKSRPDD